MAFAGGVVYAIGASDGDNFLGRFGEPFTIAASGTVIPPGAYYTSNSFTVRDPDDAVLSTHTAGYCISDGQSVKTAAANVVLIPVGFKGWDGWNGPQWPWPSPWPLTSSAPTKPTFA